MAFPLSWWGTPGQGSGEHCKNMHRKAPQSCAKSVPRFRTCSQIEFMVRSNQVPLPDFVAGSPGRDPGGLWAIPARGPVIGSANVGGPRAAIGIGWSGPGGGDESLDRRHASSSPRLRGTRILPPRTIVGARFIPAPAGNTSPSLCVRRSRPVHPRACGEHATSGGTGASPRGSSPRLRGTLPAEQARCVGRRFIPAPAGNTRMPDIPRLDRAVHPRACGEHYAYVALGPDTIGSSPRLRGTPETLPG